MKTYNGSFNITEMADEIYNIVINESLPANRGYDYDTFEGLKKIGEYIQRHKSDILNYQGGAAWDRAFAKMPKAQQDEYLTLVDESGYVAPKNDEGMALDAFAIELKRKSIADRYINEIEQSIQDQLRKRIASELASV
jgi:hypothetical protein